MAENTTNPVGNINKSSHKVVLTAVFFVILLSWYYMFFEMSMNMASISQWSHFDIFMLFIMWTIMMAGMMLPSALPVILLVNKLNLQRIKKVRSYTHTLYFVLGYLLTWATYSVMITLVQWWLHHWSLLSPMMSSANDVFSGLLLVIAGGYQFTPLKQSCLQSCRSPLSVLTTQWREGTWGAILLGLKHGQYCLGCCWFLMALLFVTGVMNLKWILVLTLLVIIEKTLFKAQFISKFIGVVLIVLGGILLV